MVTRCNTPSVRSIPAILYASQMLFDQSHVSTKSNLRLKLDRNRLSFRLGANRQQTQRQHGRHQD